MQKIGINAKLRKFAQLFINVCGKDLRVTNCHGIVIFSVKIVLNILVLRVKFRLHIAEGMCAEIGSFDVLIVNMS